MEDPAIVELAEAAHPPRSVRWGPWKMGPVEGSPPRRLKLLLLHGFAGSPAELRPLGGALASRGFSSQAPLLPGHGENLQAMQEVQLQDWLDAVSLTYERLHSDDSPVAVIGFCLGGALAVRLAGQLNPRALCCMATPAGPLPEAAFPRMAGLRSTARSVDDSPSAEVRRWRHLGCHQLVPEAFFAQYQALLKQMQDALREIRCPIMVAQSRGDGITPPADAERLLEAIRGERRKLVWSRKAGHALPVDVGRRALFAEVASFLEQEDEAASSLFSPRL